MSWISWTSLVPTLLILSASLAWWFTEPKNARINLIAAVGVALFCWAVAPGLSRDISYSLYASSLDVIVALHLDLVIARHAKMLVTGAAVVWYVGDLGCCCTRRRPVLPPCDACNRRALAGSSFVRACRLVRRAWQTLWKPVPELIGILGVEVPDPPDVSLAGIRADAATVNWTRSPANRSVQKFLIQVNGVVGELGARAVRRKR